MMAHILRLLFRVTSLYNLARMFPELLETYPNLGVMETKRFKWELRIIGWDSYDLYERTQSTTAYRGCYY